MDLKYILNPEIPTNKAQSDYSKLVLKAQTIESISQDDAITNNITNTQDDVRFDSKNHQLHQPSLDTISAESISDDQLESQLRKLNL